MTTTIDILLTAYEGTPFLTEQLHSLTMQTHADWRLWVRDDGSSDGTADHMRWFATRDPRVHVLEDGERRGPPAGFGWLMEQLPEETRYVMFCDQDDYWRANKIEVTLAAMRAAEAEHGADTPLLAHTDLTVVDRYLNLLHESFWAYQKLDPGRATLRSLLVENTVTGCAVMINRSLLELGTPVPPGAVMHDWWLALVAARFGTIVPVPVATIMYRQHDRNAMGIRRPWGPRMPSPSEAMDAFARRAGLRGTLNATAAQARAFRERYGDRLTRAERRMLERFAEVDDCGWLRRKLRVLQHHTVSRHGWTRNAGRVLRA